MKILVVDDAQDMRLVLRKYLQTLGHEVEVAVDGQQAWDLLQQEDFSTVISDWMMPNVNGLELCQKIRAHPGTRYTYIILLTGLSTKEDLIQGLDAGADDFAVKPIQFDELKVRLNAAERVINSEASLNLKNQELDEAHRGLQRAHETLLTDLESAAIVQESLLPKPMVHEKVSSAWFYHPAILIGGDSFNHFFITEKLMVFYVIDVSGHGVSSALVSTSLHSQLRSLIALRDVAKPEVDLSTLLEKKITELNQSFLAKHAHTHYFTMAMAIADFSTHEIHLVQAGHPEPLFYNQETGTYDILKLHGFPVGLIEEATYQAHRITFQAGDKLVLYSDGLNEMTSMQNRQLLELENLQQHFNVIGDEPPATIIDKASQQWFVAEEMDECPDDLSILVFQFV